MPVHGACPHHCEARGVGSGASDGPVRLSVPGDYPAGLYNGSVLPGCGARPSSAIVTQLGGHHYFCHERKPAGFHGLKAERHADIISMCGFRRLGTACNYPHPLLRAPVDDVVGTSSLVLNLRLIVSIVQLFSGVKQFKNAIVAYGNNGKQEWLGSDSECFRYVQAAFRFVSGEAYGCWDCVCFRVLRYSFTRAAPAAFVARRDSAAARSLRWRCSAVRALCSCWA